LVVFNVYEPPNASGDRIDRATKLVFVRDGFHWWAALVPAAWLLIKGLWPEFLVFVVGAGLLAWLLEAVGASPEIGGMIFFVVQLLIGFEAGLIYTSSLERRGWQWQGTVTGRRLADCERSFFETWLTSQPSEPLPSKSTPPRDQDPGQSWGQSWTQTALQGAKDTVARGARLIGAKA
jgi:hypothetical protein